MKKSLQRPLPLLDLDTGGAVREITEKIKTQVRSILRKRGTVVAVSGGIDSAVCAALSAQALGGDRVLALMMPERDSSSDSARLAEILIQQFHLQSLTIDITKILESTGCYRYQEEAIREVVPVYTKGWKHKITLPSLLESSRLNLSRLTVESPTGQLSTHRMTPSAYLKLVAATNFKQRVRKMLEYFHADRLNYAVCGTPNRLEFDQGFFVKLGDGNADFKPIAHLYKSQVYGIAKELGIPAEIRERTPTTDTFGLEQTQEEFYFGLPHELMDLCLFGHNHALPVEEIAAETGLTVPQVQRIYDDIDAKRRTTAPLHLSPLLAGPVPEIEKLLATLLESHQARNQ